ncbi:MAG: SDR family oxidoreductase, partial [Actinobacteria bacterium]|nr:SDR family oxidoreductase [Actinomycetota bacterium]
REGTAEQVVQAAIDAYGRVDILVCNAGVGWQYGEEHPGTMAALHEVSLENWRDVVGGVDLEGYFTMMRAALPHMLEQGSGAIVSVASMAGLTGLYDAHAYTATKGALINLTRSLAITYAKHGVRANCLCPGFIDTPLIEPAIDLFKDEETRWAMVPMGRAGTAEEMARAVLFLASDDSSYCTGTALLADGGSTSRSFTA